MCLGVYRCFFPFFRHSGQNTEDRLTSSEEPVLVPLTLPNLMSSQWSCFKNPPLGGNSGSKGGAAVELAVVCRNFCNYHSPLASANLVKIF